MPSVLTRIFGLWAHVSESMPSARMACSTDKSTAPKDFRSVEDGAGCEARTVDLDRNQMTVPKR
jgi:hypothetical protein